MTKDELNERLALTYEPKPTAEVLSLRADFFISKTKAWRMDHDRVWHATDFTSDYWFKRLIVEHRIHVVRWSGSVWQAFSEVGGMAATSWPEAKHEDPAVAVAECALKIREAR